MPLWKTIDFHFHNPAELLKKRSELTTNGEMPSWNKFLLRPKKEIYVFGAACFSFYYYFFIQRGYGTLKQNLVKFK